jgi:TonB family protein
LNSGYRAVYRDSCSLFRAIKEVMPDNRQHAEDPLAIGERRLSARAPVSPQAFVKFGESNYGFVFNISETGLVFAPTGSLTLAIGAVAKMRFLLPESREWIQTSGEVAWIADSQKEAGVRFVDLDPDTRDRIRNWISKEPTRAQLPRQRNAVPELDASVNDGTRTPGPSNGAAATHATFVDGTTLNAILADPARLLRETKGAREKFAPQPAKTVADGSLQVAGSMHVPERRSHIRRRVLSLEYIDLGSSNGGILLNLSEGGMYVQAVAGLSSDDLPQIGFRLPDSGYLVKTNAQVAWIGESKKDAGIQFLNLPEAARLKIREWVAVEHPPVQSANELATDVAPVRKKTERLLEMPPPGLAKKLPKPQEVSASISQTQDGDLVAPPSAASVKQPAPTAVELLHLSGPILQKRLGELNRISKEANAEVSSPDLVQLRSWRSLVAAIVIVVLLSFVAGWMVAGPGGRKQLLSIFERQQNDASGETQNSSPSPSSDAAAENIPPAPTANDTSQQPVQQSPSAPVVTSTPPDKPQPAKSNGNAQPLPTHAKGSDLSAANLSTPPTQKPAAPVAHLNVPPSTPGDANRAARPSQPLTSSAASNTPGALAQNKPQEIRSTAAQTAPPVTAPPVSNSALKSSPSPAVSNASPPPPTGTVASQSPNANPNPVATQPPTHADSAPVAAKPPAPVEVVKGTVSVSASPFPSIRVPPEMKSQVSKQGASLQVGQLISRVEPVYPEDAERQRIEGAVKLHVIIDRDGNIQDIDQMTGPPLLEAAAANAVRKWRYKPTSLGGQPVEAGLDVTVTFRLQTTHAN